MGSWDAHLWAKAGDFLVGTLYPRGLLISAVVVAGGLLLRRVSPALRAAFWTAGAGALVTLLALPLFGGRLPSWELGLIEFPTVLLSGPLADGLGGGIGQRAGFPWIAWLAVVWAAGSALLLARFATHLARISVLTHRARPVGGRLAELAREVAAERGVERAWVRLGATAVPLTWGSRRPVVLLPPEAEAWPPELQRAILHHEFAHIKRRDYLGLVLLELCRVVHWPNPLAWYLLRHARVDQEIACDDAAIRSGIAPVQYARHLVEIARAFAVGPRNLVGALPALGVTPLVTRVEAALRRRANRQPLTGRAVGAALLLVTAAAGPMAAANLWSCVEAAPAAEYGAPHAEASPARTPRPGDRLPELLST